MRARQLVAGLATYLPGVYRLFSKGTGGTNSARYCYSVWLRHLVMAQRNGLSTNPKIVAELGPGDSLGIGLAALISGCEQYYAFDVVEYANVERNIAIFDELTALFANRTPIPGDDAFPDVKPDLVSYDFPVDILDEARLTTALESKRIATIRNAICISEGNNSVIQYKVPWCGPSVVRRESVDMIFSQAVMEHVDDVKDTYKAIRSWLKPNGYVSNQIDFKCHGTAREWNGHWAYSDLLWKLIKGKRPYFLNRVPHSEHISALMKAGLTVVCDKTVQSKSSLTQSDLARRFRRISDDDLMTSGAFIQAKRAASDQIDDRVE
jgi:hypothetical protein